jgi:8-oxo-dGTP pyrophosphatase MutT (NUDIX family)
MPIPQNSTKRRGAVGVIVRDERLLVIQRSEFVPAPLTYCFPGGGIEANETEEEALVREIQEELGVPVAPMRRLWRSTTRWGVDLAWWLADFPAEFEPRPAPAEVASVQWCTLDEMARLPALLGSNREFLAALAKGEIQLDLSDSAPCCRLELRERSAG